jgi:NADPH:quinone reductase
VGSLRVKKGDSVLIRGGTSSVGLATAELAKLYGVKVYSTTRSSDKAKKLAPLVGGEEHVIIDNGNISEEVMKRTDGKGVDYCVELVGGQESLKDSARALKPNGTLCMVGILSNTASKYKTNAAHVDGEWVYKEFEPMVLLFPGKYLTVASSVSLPNALSAYLNPVSDMLYLNNVLNSDVMLQNIPMASVPFQEWIDAIGDGRININLDRTFKLEEAGKAHEYMEANKVSTSLFVLSGVCGVRFLFWVFCGGAALFQADRSRRAERWYSWFRRDNGHSRLVHGTCCNGYCSARSHIFTSFVSGTRRSVRSLGGL